MKRAAYFSTAETRPAGQRLLFSFLAAWTLINLLQAGFTGLDGDEAYYWLFSQRLDWGYFDHPPMVALAVKLGETFGHAPLFTRLGTVLLSTAALYMAFKALPDHLQNAKLYVLTVSSVVLFHVYGFIVTPDSSLFFFTAAFFLAYKRYLQKDSLANAILLALTIVGLLYSKYHGVLPVFFTFLSNPRLALKPTAWLAVLLVVAGLVPHLLWQYHHDWPTFRYHLSERIGSRYRIDKSTNYLLSQLLVWGPFTTAPVLYNFFRKREGGLYIRAHYFTFFGMLLFFFLNSFRSTIEPHWTLAAGISFCIITLSVWQQGSDLLRKWLVRLMWVNIALLLIVRVLAALPAGPLQKMMAFRAQSFGKEFADSLYSRAKGTAVVFPDSYLLPALYRYYHPQETGIGYATIFSRKNYFSISGDEATLHDGKVLIAFQNMRDSSDAFVSNRYAAVFLHGMNPFQAVNSLKIHWINQVKKAKRGDVLKMRIALTNPSTLSIDGAGLGLSYAFIRTKKEYVVATEVVPVGDAQLVPGYQKTFDLSVKLPEISGSYRLIFSVVQPPLDGTFASPFYNVEVE